MQINLKFSFPIRGEQKLNNVEIIVWNQNNFVNKSIIGRRGLVG